MGDKFKGYHNATLKIMARLERVLANQVKPLINRQYIDSAKLVEHGVMDINFIVDAQRLRTKMTLATHYRRVALIAGKRADTMFNPKKAKSMSEAFWAAVDSYIATTTATKVTQVTNTTKKMINQTIKNGLKDGFSNYEIAKTLRKTGKIDSKFRSLRIARTETHGAYNYATDESVKDTGYQFTRVWSASKDERTRIPHLAADGQERDQDTPFEINFKGVAEKLMYPGDGSLGASAGNIINCRCVLLYEMADQKPQQLVDKPVEAIESPSILLENDKNVGNEFFESTLTENDRDILNNFDAENVKILEVDRELITINRRIREIGFTDKPLLEELKQRKREVENKLYDLKEDFEDIEEEATPIFEKLRNSLISNSKISNTDVNKIIDKIEFGVDQFGQEISNLDEVKGHLFDFIKLTNGKGTSLRKITANSDRAYHSRVKGKSEIDISWVSNSEEQKSQLFHELGHSIEYDNDNILKSARQWRDSEAKSGPKKLSDLTGNSSFSDKEMALEDGFFSPYLGKVYDDGKTEVVSMVFERFTTEYSMRRLYAKDKELFKLGLSWALK